MISKDFSPLIIAWYSQHKRDLPWRKTRDPYLIWLSEIILQQTRVSQGSPYYLKFVEAFPTLADLAGADQDQVLRLWQGLGYYSRARNMHKCARLILTEHDGHFPSTYEELMRLPGIGRYTAAAIASLAFNVPTPSIDGNVYRVLSRVFGVESDIAGSGTFKEFFQLAEGLMDKSQPGEFNQAMMEFGATVCTPRSPACVDCIFKDNCEANFQSKQLTLPVKSKKIKKRTRYFNYMIVKVGNLLALSQRPEGDIWQGLFEFHLIESDRLRSWDELQSDLMKDLHRSGAMIEEDPEIVKHVLTHQTLMTRFLLAEISDTVSNRSILEINGLTLYNLAEIDSLAKPVLIANYLNKRLISIDL